MNSKDQIMIKRLKEQMKISGLNARQLSLKANVGKSFIYDILSGKSTNPTTKKIQAVADALGISMQYLMCESGNDNHIKDEDYVFIDSLYKDEVNTHNSIEANTSKKLKLSFKKDWIKKTLNTNIENIRSLIINGDYMSPTLQNGDIALIDISKKTPNPPGIYILYDGLGLVVKRLESIKKSNENVIYVTADNKNYKSYECSLSELNIIGRIIWFSRAVG
ncbi:MAG: LexA family transcriptional regulator [Rickettsiales bacterium]|nr:LexA family transcriptional regulator [Pseudomonadota bacterium]MDA0965823.1 LexA family transcriptional regulator [Pseudomonadota bacterium]MDG4542707.1 LexA family transcriptional regulator [Rickettsiales bacterium]MDG4545211.1 LexA family transcriptional regulator [Rickettsiales bacterium]MDG4547334.1 LexA family transcriptional regulator [Rickettsiales bacterium]